MKKKTISVEQMPDSTPRAEWGAADDLRQRAEAQVKKQANPPKTLPVDDPLRLVHELQVHQVELEMQNEELLRARDEAAAGLERYTDLYDFAPAGYFTLDREGKIRQLNLNGAGLLGAVRAELVDRRFGLFISPDNLAVFEPFFEAVFLSETKQVCEVGLQTGTRPARWVRLEGLADSDGQACKIAAVDISEHKQAETKIRERELKYRMLFETSLDGILLGTPDGMILTANPGACRMLGMTQAEIIRDGEAGILDAGDPRLAQLLAERARTGILKAELTFKRQDGTRFAGELTSAAYQTEHGETRICVTFRDISRRLQAEEALEHLNTELEQRIKERTGELAQANLVLNEKIIELVKTQESLQNLYLHYRTMVDNTHDWETWLDEDGHYVYCSPSCEQVSGYTAEDFMNKPGLLEQIIHPEDLPGWQKHNEAESSSPLGEQIEFRIRRRDGSTVWIEHVCKPVQYREGHFSGIRGSNRDITGRRRMEEDLRKREERYRLMMDTAQEGIWLLDHEGKVTYTNQRLATMLGYSVDEMVGQPYFEFMDDAARNEAAAHFDSCQQGTGEQYDFCYRRRDGTDLWAIVCASPLRAADGSVTGALALITDISRRKRAEAGILRQAARAEALLQTAARLNEHLDLDTLLHSVCREAAAALQAPAAWINLYDAQQDALCYAADAGMPPAFKDGYQPVLRAQYEAAGGDKGPLVILAEQQETGGMRNQALYSALNIRWVALASMVQDGQLIGTISTVSFDQARRFSEDDLGLLQGVADQAALMIANARLFEQVKAGRVQMSALSLALLDATETERRALALELHDELGQVLNRVKLSLDMAPLLGKEGEREQYLLASSLVLDLIRRVQRISLDLRPSILDDLGLLPALEWLFNTYNEQNGCQVQFKSDGLDQRFPARVEVAAYRIVQESLTNISRHAADKNAGVEARADGEALYISVSDQGGGFDVQAALGRRNSTGLSGMRERARQLGGELGIISTPGQGTRISVRLPLVSGTGP